MIERFHITKISPVNSFKKKLWAIAGLTTILSALAGLVGYSQPLMPITPQTRTPGIEMKVIKRSYSNITTGLCIGKEIYSFANVIVSGPILQGFYDSITNFLRRMDFDIYPNYFPSLKNLNVKLGAGIENRSPQTLELMVGLGDSYANENASFTIEATLGGYFSSNGSETILTYYLGMEKDINNITPFTVFGFNATEVGSSIDVSAGLRYHLLDGSSLILSLGTAIPKMKTSAAISYNKNNVAITFSGNTKEFKFSMDASF